MDALVLLGALAILLAIGVPVAYSLGISSIVGAIWLGMPLEGVMIKISSGLSSFTLLAIPFFVLAGAHRLGLHLQHQGDEIDGAIIESPGFLAQ